MLWAVFLNHCTNDAINFRWIRFLFGTMHRKIPRLQMSEWQLLIPSYIISNNMHLILWDGASIISCNNIIYYYETEGILPSLVAREHKIPPILLAMLEHQLKHNAYVHLKRYNLCLYISLILQFAGFRPFR